MDSERYEGKHPAFSAPYGEAGKRGENKVVQTAEDTQFAADGMVLTIDDGEQRMVCQGIVIDNKFNAAHPEQAKSRADRPRGVERKFISVDELPFRAPKKTHDEKARQFFQTIPEPQLAGLKHVIGAITALTSRQAPEEFDAETFLDRMEQESDGEITNADMAHFLNQDLIAAGRNPVYSDKMLAAQNAAIVRREQKRKKKLKRK